jgi:hypothetical protein
MVPSSMSAWPHLIQENKAAAHYRGNLKKEEVDTGSPWEMMGRESSAPTAHKESA